MQHQDQYYLEDPQLIDYADGNQRTLYTVSPNMVHLEEIGRVSPRH